MQNFLELITDIYADNPENSGIVLIVDMIQ